MNKFTEEQMKAISADGNLIVVSAAAGSGKTSVLVERVIKKLLKGLSLANLLIVTFTNAAAKEMKDRIKSRILENIDKHPELANELLLLDDSLICTIDSFCLRVVKIKADYLGISTNFRIMSQYESDILKYKAISLAIEKVYESKNKDFIEVIDLLSGEGNEDKFIDIMKSWINFSSTLGNVNQFIEKSLKNFEVPFFKTEMNNFLRDYIIQEINYAISFLEIAIDLSSKDDELSKKYLPYIKSNYFQLKKISRIKKTFEILEHLGSFKFLKLKPVKSSENKHEVKNILDICKKIIIKLKKISINEERKYLKRVMSNFFEISAMVFEFLRDMKMKNNCFDFCDMEKMALNVLQNKDNVEELCVYFEEIMIDEYQDVNDIQDKIFSSMGKKMFLVGDYKQSIYGFRGSLPEIFEQKKKSKNCVNIILDKNFRSKRNIINFINSCFRNLMTNQTNLIDYNSNEELKYGANYEDSDEKSCVSLFVLNSQETENNVRYESEFVAKKIKSLLESGTKVFDKGQVRDAKLSDFCVLTRNFNKYSNALFEEFKKNGINFKSGDESDFLECKETKFLISVLKIIENPTQDIYFTAASINPFFGFSIWELLKIRLKFPDLKLYYAAKIYSESFDDSTAKKCACIVNFLDKFLKIYKTSSLMNLVVNLIGEVKNKIGEYDSLNFEKFIYILNQFYKSAEIYNITKFLDYIIYGQFQVDLDNFDNRDSVFITSIHKAKGKEFPICFLCGCSSYFVNESSEIAFDSKFGASLKSRRLNNILEYSNIFRDSMNLYLKHQTISEELRILYVAMTRAKEKLYITSVVNKKELKWESNKLAKNKNLHSYFVKNSKNFYQWITLPKIQEYD